jgi:hypothetical protein
MGNNDKIYLTLIDEGLVVDNVDNVMFGRLIFGYDSHLYVYNKDGKLICTFSCDESVLFL